MKIHGIAQEEVPIAKSANDTIGSPRAITVTGLAVIAAFFGTFAFWAALSPLDSAVVTHGMVGTEGRRKSVQHLDGGVVRTIMAREGDLVKEGQVLMRLDQTQARAALDIYTAEVDTQTAVTARLEAETTHAGSITFPENLQNRAKEPAVKSLIQSQTELFEARRNSVAGQIATLNQNIRQAEVQSDNYANQIEALKNQYELIQKELAPKQELFEKGLATGSPVYQLQRTAAGILAQMDEYDGQIIRLTHAVGQLRSQIAQIGNDLRLKVAQELEDSRNKLAEAKERQRVAHEVLTRTVITAPVSGYVLGLSVNTVGAVIGAGDKLLEIVPSAGDFVINARLPPVAAVDIDEGMRTELRLLTPHGRKLPMIRGTVLRRSVDARPDAQNAMPYFEVEVAIDQDDLKKVPSLRLVPGTPIEVIVLTESRTALGYMLDPVKDIFRHAMREK